MSVEPKPVLCIGDLTTDIVATPLKRLPVPGESILTEKIAIYPGGNSLNTAIALRHLGDQVTIGGSVGDDALGTLLLNQSARTGAGCPWCTAGNRGDHSIDIYSAC